MTCPVCFGEDGAHGSFMGKSCPRSDAIIQEESKEAVRQEQLERIQASQETKELERLFRLESPPEP